MESLAQELLNAIIDHMPPEHLHSCSLVARRWREWSQQRYFRVIAFYDTAVDRWYENIPQDPDGIPSYVRNVKFHDTWEWNDPSVFGSVLKRFRHLKTLELSDILVPYEEVVDLVSSGEFGREIISLTIFAPQESALPALMSLVLSLPNLTELMIDGISAVAVGLPPSPLPEKTWQREPLQSLKLYWIGGCEVDFITRCGIMSRMVDMRVSEEMIEKIVACSSATMSKLVLRGT